MSGIVGMYFLDGRPMERSDLERSLQILAHRGPDERGVWNEGSIGLGQCVMHSTPESVNERLPLKSRRGSAVLVCDARLDNREELIELLELSGRAAVEIGDGELILEAWAKWGDCCPERLLGDFAFALWDAGQRVLFCARDHSGTKPLYYYRGENFFTFASEIKALFARPEVPRRLNERKLGDYLVGFYEDKVNTFYQGISRLPPAHSLLVKDNGLTLRQYWSLDPLREIRMKSDQEYAEAFREIFTVAVRCRLRCNGKVGSELSGGLDSSSITCVARNILMEQNATPLHTFSAVFPNLATINPVIDERPFVDSVIKQGGIEPHYVLADRLNPLVAPLWEMDEYVNVPNIFMELGLYRCAQEQGMRVLFSGHDGDCVVSYGLEYLEYLARRGRWIKLVRECSAIANKNTRWNGKKMMWLYGIRSLVPASVISIWRQLKGRPDHDFWLLGGVINPEFARRLGQTERFIQLSREFAKNRISPRVDHIHSITSGLDLFGLEFFNQFGALLSIEPRFPFYDKRLMEFCLAIPYDQKLRDGTTRSIFRRAMKESLPAEIQRRIDKGNLSGNFNTKFFEFGRETIEDILLKDPSIIEKYVDVDKLRRAYHFYKADPIKHDRPALKIFYAVSLALWLRHANLG